MIDFFETIGPIGTTLVVVGISILGLVVVAGVAALMARDERRNAIRSDRSIRPPPPQGSGGPAVWRHEHDIPYWTGQAAVSSSTRVSAATFLANANSELDRVMHEIEAELQREESNPPSETALRRNIHREEQWNTKKA